MTMQQTTDQWMRTWAVFCARVVLGLIFGMAGWHKVFVMTPPGHAAPPAIDSDAQPGLSGWAGLGVHREIIRDGLRFTLPGSAHALQWTLTAGTRAGTVNVHCTLNTAADAATAAALERFVVAWCAGLEAGARRVLQQRAERNAAVCDDCPPWFG